MTMKKKKQQKERLEMPNKECQNRFQTMDHQKENWKRTRMRVRKKKMKMIKNQKFHCFFEDKSKKNWQEKWKRQRKEEEKKKWQKEEGKRNERL